MLAQLPTLEDPECGHKNKKHLCPWVLQSQIFQALHWSSHSCISSSALSSWDRPKAALGLLGSQFRLPRLRNMPIVPRKPNNGCSLSAIISIQLPFPQGAQDHVLSQPFSSLDFQALLLGLPPTHSWKRLSDLCHGSSKPDSKDFCLLYTGELSASFAVL